MERKDDQPQPLGICQRFFNFLMKNLNFQTPKLITLRPDARVKQDHTTSSIVDNPKAHGVVEEDMDSQIKVMAQEEEGEVTILSPTKVPREEHQGTQEKANSTKISVGERSDVVITRVEQVQGIGVDVAQQSKIQDTIVAQAKSSTKKKSVKDEAQEKEVSKGKEKTTVSKEPSMARSQEKDLGLKVLPVLKEALSINKKSDAFIQSTKAARRTGSNLQPRTSS